MYPRLATRSALLACAVLALLGAIAIAGWLVPRLAIQHVAPPDSPFLVDVVLLVSSLVAAALVALVLYAARRVQERFDRADQASRDLARSEERYDAAIRGSFQGLWDWDVQASRVDFAPHCKTILGYGPEEPVSDLAAWTSRIHPDDRERVTAAIDAHLLQRAPFDQEFRLVAGLETTRWVRARGQAVWNALGFPVRMAGSLADVSQRKRLEAELRQKAEELAEQNRVLMQHVAAAHAAVLARSELLANLSHEIRWPLTSILGYADLLQGGPEHADARTWLARIKDDGEHLVAVINDVLDLAKIEAGQLEIEKVSTPTAGLFSEVIQLAEERTRARSLRLALEVDGRLPPAICTDALRLRQILLNLIGQAIKYTEHGEVRVVIKANPGPEATLAIDVIDASIGLTPRQIERLFEPYSQPDTTSSRLQGGTGLGLALSQRLAALLDGQITAASQPGAGTQLTLHLPIGPLADEPWIELQLAPAAAESSAGHVEPVAGSAERAAAPQAVRSETLSGNKATSAAIASAAKKPPLAGRRILLAEDSPDNQWLVTHHLQKHGAIVEVVADGLAAIAKAHAAWKSGRAFDAVLMDVQMPVLDGFEATRRLRTQGYVFPILALTAQAQNGERKKSLAAGCDDYLPKPIRVPQLLAMLTSCLAKLDAAGRDTQLAEMAP